MKTHRIFTLALCGGMIAISGHAAPNALPNALPAAWPISRYQKLMTKSPFAVATPDAQTVSTPGFASSLYVSGIAKIGASNFVTVASRDTKASSFSLTTNGEPTPDGIQLVSVQWAAQLANSKVTIKKGSDVATLSFDQQSLQKNLTPVEPLATPTPDDRRARWEQRRREFEARFRARHHDDNGNPSTMPETRVIRRSGQIPSGR